MITKNARGRLQSFVNEAKNLLTTYITHTLQSKYGIWVDGTVRPIWDLPLSEPEVIHISKLLRQRLDHIKNSIPGECESGSIEDKKKTATAVAQLISEQAFTLLNRLAAIRMAGERNIIQPAIEGGFESDGFTQYDAVTGGGTVGTTFERYTWFIFSVFDELSIELPAVFNRYSPYGLIWFDENTLLKFFDIINAENLSAFYDTNTGKTINFWQEDETLGWIFQYYNSLEERRKMRDESKKPRNSREMAVRNQFFTPNYVVRFLTDNTLGRIWWEMTGGKSKAIEEQCQYLIHRDSEEFETRPIKEPTDITLLDPTCGSMHFGLYAFSVFETIYIDAWDNHPELLGKDNPIKNFRYEYTREQFQQLVPKLILEHNIFGVEIDPRALQIAAVSLWLRAQKSWEEQGINSDQRPLILKSNLVLAEPMPGNKKLLRELTEGMDSPMKKLVGTVWDKMKLAGETGLLLKMEKEIEADINGLKKNWHKYKENKNNRILLEFTDDIKRNNEEIIKELDAIKKLNKEQFFSEVATLLREKIGEIAGKMTDIEGYENSLFSEDAVRGLAFIEMCMRRFDVIVMNPPFGEGSMNSSSYLDKEYKDWNKNLVSAFFIRMQEMLTDNGKLGAIFDRTVMIKSSFESFRQNNLCGFITNCADTGWNVLDANVETSTLIIEKKSSKEKGLFLDILEIDSDEKAEQLYSLISSWNKGNNEKWIHNVSSIDFINLPNSIIGYNFEKHILELFKNKNIEQRDFYAMQGVGFVSPIHFRLFYELSNSINFKHMYNGADYSLFYSPYQEVTSWEKEGMLVKAHVSYRSSNLGSQFKQGICYGKRGEFLDSQILKKNFFFTKEGQGIPIISQIRALTCLSFINSILSQYTINLYCAQHKGNGYVNLLPMPNYDGKEDEIEKLVNEIIDIKRWWFSLDETNLEYHGLMGQIEIKESLDEALDKLQVKLDNDWVKYEHLVSQNDSLWMDLAEIKEGSEFRQTLIKYKLLRPNEELLSIDKASTNNIIDRKTIAAEIVQELVGLALGRWDMAFASGETQIPEFGDVFDPLPFMPVVELNTNNSKPKSNFKPQNLDGIIPAGSRHNNLTDLVRSAMSYLWKEKAADIEAEITSLLGVESLRDWLDSPTGFFDYHLTRYTKSRRKAPIYWPISTTSGEIFCWIYYPALNKDTLKKVTLLIDEEINNLNSQLNTADANYDSNKANKLRIKIDELHLMKKEVLSVISLPYVPNHDDGVPVTVSPLRNLFSLTRWKRECEENWEKISSGEYDWSHLAYSLRPSQIRTKVKKDWCLALTHGLEELCENKPKEKKAKKTKKEKSKENILFESDYSE